VLFVLSVCLPQIVAALVGGFLLIAVGGEQIMMLGIAGLSLVCAAAAVRFIDEKRPADE